MNKYLDITAVTKLKHAELWELCKKLGSQSALADCLGVSATELSRWVNLQSVPSPAKRKLIEEKLYELTGKLYPDLFPRKLCEATEFLTAPKTAEKRERFKVEALLESANDARRRLTLEAPSTDRAELRERLREAFKRLTPRWRFVLERRYGLFDGHQWSQEEIAKELRVTKSRAQQLEARAIKQLQSPEVAQLLFDFLEDSHRHPSKFPKREARWPSEIYDVESKPKGKASPS